jgi:hypothetical protein
LSELETESSRAGAIAGRLFETEIKRLRDDITNLQGITSSAGQSMFQADDTQAVRAHLH